MEKRTKIILASTSPRRKALIGRIIKGFKIMPSNYEEDMSLKLEPKELAKTLAHGKAAKVAKRERGIIIAADTFISLDNEVIGKPKSKKHAEEMLKKFSNKTHEVITGLAIINTETQEKILETDTTRITFRKITSKQIREYIATGEPMDKAGAYALQGIGGKLIEKIEGSRTGAIGLPLEKLSELLNKMGVKTKK